MRVTGTVQGVGFRPFVYREARELGLAGFVLNDEHGVVIEAEGDPSAVDDLVRRLREKAPPLAEVEGVALSERSVLGDDEFEIVESVSAGSADALVSPDVSTCDACITELRDPNDRRYRYPFINCTDCGPRFTIVKDVPYDRPLTTMAGFRMCADCQAEYDDPADRRFHAQPNACPVCGPQVPGTSHNAHTDVIAAAAAKLTEGAIVAVKGVGGYHLACDARNEDAVATLRARKHRESKPFALMAPDIETAHELVELTPVEEDLLTGRDRPIVIARAKPGAPVASAVAPASRDLGVMLPHAPLQHVLCGDFGATLVMTSANVSDEPIAYEDEDATTRLDGIADAFLTHNRPIHMRTDDSVVRALEGRPPILIRRSRGFVPRATALPVPATQDILGCGAELKSTFCVARGERAWVGHHIGDLKNWETLSSYREGVAHFERLFSVKPQVIAHDLHPDYLSTRYATERAESDGTRLVAVQHHHAHLAACLAEHRESGPALGAVFDGTGLGPDRTVWGGEFLVGDLATYERVGMLMPVRLPGGDRAALEPWRMAVSWLAHANGEELPAIPRALEGRVEHSAWESVASLVRTGTGSPLTTSAGRLFDAVAAICGICPTVDYEGQAAAELEGAADPGVRDAYEMDLHGGGEAPLVLDPRPVVTAATADMAGGAGASVVSARFHNGLVQATAAVCEHICADRDLATIVLSGGVFQNRLLTERTADALVKTGLRVLIPAALPPNDGGVSFGQVAVAAATIEGGAT